MSIFSLKKMTFGSLFKQPETIQYPAQTKEAPAQLKGSVVNHVETCILCGICSKRCPTASIKVDKPTHVWSINHYSCIQCGYCVRECPKSCLEMMPNYAPAATQKVWDEFEVPEQVKPAKSVEEQN